MNRLKPILIAVLLLGFGLAPARAVPAPENRTPVEATVTAVGGADAKGHRQFTLKIISATGDRTYKEGSTLVVVSQEKPPLSLKVNDTIRATVSLVGDEWHNQTRLFNVTVTRRRADQPLRRPQASFTVLKPARLAIRSHEEWAKTVLPIQSPVAGRAFVPKIFWDREIALFVSMGEQTSTGFSIKITKAQERLHEIIVSVKTQRPKPGQIVGDAITHPADLVAIPKSDLPVRFVAEGDEEKPFAVPFKVLANVSQGRQKEPLQQVVTDAKAWAKTWALAGGKEAKRPQIDFDKKRVIALFLGECATSGAPFIRIEKVTRTADALEVQIKSSRAAGVLQALCYPHAIAVLDKSSFPVRFLEPVSILKKLSGKISTVQKKQTRVITTKEAWAKLVAQIGPSKKGVFTPDFTRQTVLAAFAGDTAPGTRLRITRIEKRQGTLQVETVTTHGQPGKGEQARPFALALIEKPNLPVTFTHRDVMGVAPVKPLLYAVGRLIILFQAGVAHEEQLTLIKALGAEPARRIKSINGYILTLPKDQIPAERAAIEKVMEAFRKKFQDHPKIKSAEFDMIMRLQPMPMPHPRPGGR